MNDASEERTLLYDKTREDLLKRQLSNSQIFDNAILTLSSGSLAVSLTFIRDIVPIDKATCIGLLKFSWWLFGFSIVITIASFIVSQIGIKKQLNYAENYYLKGKDEFRSKRNLPAIFTDYLNNISGALFILGVLITVIFVSINMKGESQMEKEKDMQSTVGGALIPNLQEVPVSLKKGATIPDLQPVTPPASPTNSQPQTLNQSGESPSTSTHDD